jgi:hypothetical protein
VLNTAGIERIIPENLKAISKRRDGTRIVTGPGTVPGPIEAEENKVTSQDAGPPTTLLAATLPIRIVEEVLL